jgi:hypothetical protein
MILRKYWWPNNLNKESWTQTTCGVQIQTHQIQETKPPCFYEENVKLHAEKYIYIYIVKHIISSLHKHDKKNMLQ